MKIACLTDCISRRAGGMHVSVRRLMQSLQAAGDEVSVFTINDEFTGADQGLWSPLPVVVSEARGPRPLGYVPALSRHLESFAPGALSVHGLWTYKSLVALRWRRRTGRPVIVHPHGMLDPWAVRNSAWKKKLAGAAFEHRHLHEASCLRALCQSEADAMRAFGLRNPIAVIPNGIDPLPPRAGEAIPVGPWRERIEPGLKVLLYLGRLHPKKGLPNLLRAWADVFGASLPAPWVLAVAGWDEGGHEAELQRLCGELRLRSADMRTAGAAQLGAGSVLFLGPQFNAAKVACYAACDAFVLPSFSEGLPMAVLEAWAYGKPVLMTPECNLPEGFAANAAIRIATDRDSIAGGLRELFGASPAALGAFATNGRDLVSRKFAWPQIAGEMREVIAWLDRGGARPACVSTV